MKPSARIEYAYKAIIELGLRYESNTPVQIHDISRVQKIPEKFLVQLLLRLKNAHIVSSARGVSGGYFLARPPAQITLADVVVAIDDNMLQPAENRRGGRMTSAERLFADVWDGLNDAVKIRLEGVRLDALIARLRDDEPMYQI